MRTWKGMEEKFKEKEKKDQRLREEEICMILPFCEGGNPIPLGVKD